MVYRIFLTLLTLALGALVHALLRAERGSSAPPGQSGGGAADASQDGAAGEPCLAVTGSGKRCTRLALPGSSYCWQHAGSR